MMRHDLSHWPLVITVAQGPSSLAEIGAFQEEWGRCLARGEPFATLRIFADADAMAHPPGSSQMAKQWLQTYREAIRQHVMGMATVVPASDYASMRKMNAEKLFGVPAEFFPQTPDALDWLRDRAFAPRGIPFDEAAITSAVNALLPSPS